MDVPSPADDALAQPTRARIFGFLVDRRGPAGTDEIAEHFGLQPNGVRRHLERLLEKGFVIRERVRHGHGRPRDSWAISPQAQPGDRHPSAYGELALWLAMSVEASPARIREVRRSGQRIGREAAPKPTGDPGADLRDAFSALGFEPKLEGTEDGFCCRLGNCPYRQAAAQNPDLICNLHRGITSGVLEAIAPEAKLVEFTPHDPDQAGCVVAVTDR
jgi:predicted ArsR family transcriptional regulator